MNERFAHCIELLLQGKIVCEVLHEENFRYLGNHQQRDKVDLFLHQIGRKLLMTGDKAGYYCAYSELKNPKHRQAVKKQFEQVMGDLEGLIAWIRLVRGTEVNSRPLEAGSKLLESELLSAIEESSMLKNQLDDIAHKFKKSVQSKESKIRLRAVLGYLEDKEYLKCLGHSGAVYRATAKWSLVYDQLEFIQQHEGIVVVEEQDLSSQTELF